MIFKRLLTAWFLVFTLLSSVAWAHAGHGDENHVNSALNTSMDQDHPLPWQNDACSDHCCHAAAHVVGLIVGVSTPIAVEPFSVDLSPVDIQPYSRPLTPPYHPPIV